MADKKGGYLRPTTVSRISSSWNDHRNRTPPSTEPGTDYACAYGSALYAPEDGVVVDLKHSTSSGTGRYVTIDLNDGRRVRLLHLSRVLVNSGQKVKRGQEVAKSGASGFGKEWGYGAHVHTTLWERQAYSFGRNATIDFNPQVGADNDGPGGAGASTKYEQWVADVQNALNRWYKAGLVVDGILGPRTTAAIRNAQIALQKEGLYKGKIDGIWGPQTNSALNAHRDKLQVKPSTKYHTGGVNDLGTIGDVRGLQKIAKLYGYTGSIDNKWGGGSKAGFQKFLKQNYGGSLAAWLRAKWGYSGNDQWGPNMKAAAQRANAANLRAL